MLRIELRPGEEISIGNTIVRLESKSGQVARLAINADKSVPIQRVQQQGSAASMAAEHGIQRK